MPYSLSFPFLRGTSNKNTLKKSSTTLPGFHILQALHSTPQHEELLLKFRFTEALAAALSTQRCEVGAG